jgi:hypothetical protein
MPKLKHHGPSRYRFADNPAEELFAQLWEEHNERGGGFSTLAYLLDPEHQHSPRKPTQKQATAAAAVIQWLGSPVGQFFLQSAKFANVIGQQDAPDVHTFGYRTIIRVLLDVIHNKELAGEFPHEVLMLGSELLGYEPKTKRKKKR